MAKKKKQDDAAADNTADTGADDAADAPQASADAPADTQASPEAAAPAQEAPSAAPSGPPTWKVLKDKTFSLYGQILRWKAGSTHEMWPDVAQYCKDAGVELEQVK